MVTVPMLVSMLAKLTFPLMFNEPPLAIVKGAPLSVPPDQLKGPLTVTAPVKLIVPFVKFTVSLSAGTPEGAQLFGVNQSVDEAPVQVKVVARHCSDHNHKHKPSSGVRIVSGCCQAILLRFPYRSIDVI
jgi:hypothetical protein